MKKNEMGKKSYFVVIAVVIVITLKYTTRTSTNTCPSKIHTQQQQPERHMTIQTSYTQQNIRCERGGGGYFETSKKSLKQHMQMCPAFPQHAPYTPFPTRYQ